LSLFISADNQFIPIRDVATDTPGLRIGRQTVIQEIPQMFRAMRCMRLIARPSLNVQR